MGVFDRRGGKKAVRVGKLGVSSHHAQCDAPPFKALNARPIHVRCTSHHLCPLGNQIRAVPAGTYTLHRFLGRCGKRIIYTPLALSILPPWPSILLFDASFKFDALTVNALPSCLASRQTVGRGMILDMRCLVDLEM